MSRWIALSLLVMTVSGCDNVVWGGTDIALQPPLPRAALMGANPDSGVVEVEEDESLPSLPQGPLLLAGRRDGAQATLIVVGEIQDGTLSPLPEEMATEGYQARFQERLLAPGTEFVLFAGGQRVGRLVASETDVDTRFCAPRPTVTGAVELVPGAVSVGRLLALSATAADGYERGTLRSYSHNYDQRVASLALASEAIPIVSAPWPPSLLEARADIQAFRLAENDVPSIATTFVYQDQVAVGAPGTGAYSLFILGETSPGADYRRGYTWYRRADQDGKGVPRYFDHLDWDGDGSSELLLDVFGQEARWFAGLTRVDGSWTRSFQDSCGGGPTIADE